MSEIVEKQPVEKQSQPNAFVLKRIYRLRDILEEIKVEIEAIRDTRSLEDWQSQAEVYLDTRQEVLIRMHRTHLQALRALTGGAEVYEAHIIYADNCLRY